MLTLYGTEFCHLCHDAQTLLRQLQLDWQDVDIAEDDALMARYGTRIPVLAQGAEELGWPFGQDDIVKWLRTVTP